MNKNFLHSPTAIKNFLTSPVVSQLCFLLQHSYSKQSYGCSIPGVAFFSFHRYWGTKTDYKHLLRLFVARIFLCSCQQKPISSPPGMVYINSADDSKALFIDETLVYFKQLAAFAKGTSYKTLAEMIGYAGLFIEKIGLWSFVPNANCMNHLDSIEKANKDKTFSQMSWNDVVVYCNSAGKRLPTKLEFELEANSSDESHPLQYNETVCMIMAMFWILLYMLVNLTSIDYIIALAINKFSGISLAACMIGLGFFAIYITLGSMKVIGRKWYDVSSIISDYEERIFEFGRIQKLQQNINSKMLSLPIIKERERLGAMLVRPSKIVCIGLTYIEHVRGTASTPPSEPVIFLKSTTAMCGPFDNIIIPKDSSKTDWEVEVAFVIGKKASYVSEQEALHHLAGHCLHYDVSEREYQLERGGKWDKGKGCDTFAPMGPWLVTSDEIDDVHNLNVWLRVNGIEVQRNNTSNLIFNIPFSVSYVSQYMTPLRGDVISIVTPAGVGLGFSQPRYLNPRNVVELGADSLGVSRQTCQSFNQNMTNDFFEPTKTVII